MLAGESLLGLPHGVRRGARQRSRDLRGDGEAPSPPGLRPRCTAQRAQRLVRDRDRSLNESAARARLEQCLGERAAAARPHQLEMSEPGPAEELRGCRIGGERLGKRRAHFSRAERLSSPTKSTTMPPPKLRSRICRAMVPAAARLAISPVRSGDPVSGVPVSTSISMPARVASKCTEPPPGRASVADSASSNTASRSIGHSVSGRCVTAAVRKSGAEFGDGRRVVHEDLVGRRRQRPGERGGKGRHGVEPSRWFELGGPVKEIRPALCQSRRFGSKRIARRRFE